MLDSKCLAFVLGGEFCRTKAPNIREIIRVIQTIIFPPTPAFPKGVVPRRGKTVAVMRRAAIWASPKPRRPGALASWWCQ